MIVYAIIMFLISILFAMIGLLIIKGRTNLIHEYHQKKVRDKVGYGKAMGKAIMGIGLSAFISGIVSLINFDNITVFAAIGVFVIGFIISFVFIWKAQNKYNSGMF